MREPMTMMAMMPPRRMLVWHHLPKWYLPVQALWPVGEAEVELASLTVGVSTVSSLPTWPWMKACRTCRHQWELS